MKKIYVVEGQTGEYADHRNWPVKAFKDKQKAKAFTDALNARAEALGISSTGCNWADSQKILPQMRELDSGVSIDYTGVSYCFYALDLE